MIKKIPIMTTKLSNNYMFINNKSFFNKQDIIEFFFKKMYNLANENSMVVFFNQNEQPICAASIGQGNPEDGYMSIRDVVQIGLLCEAKSVCIFHNHPITKGTFLAYDENTKQFKDRLAYQPSKSDVFYVEQIKRACSILDIKLDDFFIISGEKNFYNKGYKSIPICYSMKTKKRYSLKDGVLENFYKETHIIDIQQSFYNEINNHEDDYEDDYDYDEN